MAIKRLSKAKFVEFGYGQVEPNHLSSRRTGQIYAQLPANKDIEILENGQFVKYDYAAGEVNFTGKGEWMLVFNEVKVYDVRETDQDFAMIKGNYNARVYSPIGQETSDMINIGGFEENSISVPTFTVPKVMPEGTKMVPRVAKTNLGDIITLNTINEDSVAVGDELVVGDDGYLTKTAGANAGDMKWSVVKVYTMPDNQRGAKIQRIQ